VRKQLKDEQDIGRKADLAFFARLQADRLQRDTEYLEELDPASLCAAPHVRSRREEIWRPCPPAGCSSAPDATVSCGLPKHSSG
jgi:hypothetical protein